MSTQELVIDRDDPIEEVKVGEDLKSSDFVTMRVCGQLVGLPILSVQDILAPQKLTTIPLSPPEVAGSLNLRGRIVTAIEMCSAPGSLDTSLSHAAGLIEIAACHA